MLKAVCTCIGYIHCMTSASSKPNSETKPVSKWHLNSPYRPFSKVVHYIGKRVPFVYQFSSGGIEEEA
jgi:hypothetical protein